MPSPELAPNTRRLWPTAALLAALVLAGCAQSRRVLNRLMPGGPSPTTVDNDAWLASQATEGLKADRQTLPAPPADRPRTPTPEPPAPGAEAKPTPEKTAATPEPAATTARPEPSKAPTPPKPAPSEAAATPEPAPEPAPRPEPAKTAAKPKTTPAPVQRTPVAETPTPAAEAPLKPPTVKRPPAATRPKLYVTDIGAGVQSSFIAHVNDEVILTSEILRPLRQQLQAARRERTATEYARFKDALVQQALRQEIHRRLVLQEAERELDERQMKVLQQRLEQDWKKTLDKMMKRMNVGAVGELKEQLAKSGRSYRDMKEQHRRIFVSDQYLRYKLGGKVYVPRREVLDFYEQHRADFKRPPGLLWGGLMVAIGSGRTKDQAGKLAAELYARLKGGAPLVTLAKEHPFPVADDKGQVGWDNPADIRPLFRQAMAKVKLGEPTDPIETEQGFVILTPVKRRPGRDVPFEEAQEPIRRRLFSRKLDAEMERFMRDLEKNAYIRTVYDQ